MRTRLLPLLLLTQLGAQQTDEPVIRIGASGTQLYRIAVTGSDVAKIVAGDLDLTGYFQVLDPKGFPQTLLSEPMDSIAAANWTQIGAQGVAKVSSAGNEVRCVLFGVSQSERPVIQKRYTGQDARAAAHECANEIVKVLTGEDSFFGTQITFA